MAPTDRAERRRLRERGAGVTRDLKNANFAFTFGNNALPARRSSRKTPQPTAGDSNARKTPVSAQARSTRKTPTAKAATRKSSVASQSAKSQKGAPEAESARGASPKPTLREKHPERVSASAAPRNQATLSTTGKRKRNGTQVADDTDGQDELEQEDLMEKITGRRSWGEQMPAPRRKRSLVAVAEETGGDDELSLVDMVQDVANKTLVSLTARPTALTDDAASSGPQGVPSASKPAPTTAPLQTPISRKTMLPPGSKIASSNTDNPNQAEGDGDGDGEKENESHSTYIRRMYKPRLPLQAKEARPSKLKASRLVDQAAVTEPERTRRKRMPADRYSNVSVEESNVDPSLGEMFAPDSVVLDAVDLDATQGTPLFFNTPADERPLHEPENSPVRGRKRKRSGSFATELDDLASAPSLAAPATRKPTKKKQAKAQTGRRTATGPNRSTSAPAEAEDDGDGRRSAPTRQTAASTVPITVYRLSKAPNVDDEDELNDISTSASQARLPAVNPVDVLTQVTTEVIEHMADTVHRLPSTSKTNRKPDSAELKRKRAILHHFKQVLSDSLFDVTTALDAGAALTARLRVLTKHKIQLREELLQVKKQRETVALKMDRVRKDHLAWREKTTNRDELSRDLWDLEMAVKSGREACARQREDGVAVSGPELGVDMLAAMMTNHLGPTGNDAGLCARVNGLNHVLEKQAEHLEGRRG